MNLTDQHERHVVNSLPYQEGIDAYKDGILYEQNPYAHNTWNHRLWSSGWVAAEGNDIEDHGD